MTTRETHLQPAARVSGLADARTSSLPRTMRLRTICALVAAAGAALGVSTSVLTAADAGRAALNEWPEFRGPTGQGHASAKDLPLEWSKTANVAWVQPVAGSGWSSPVIGRGRIFLTTGVTGSGGNPSLRVVCFDTATGQRVWDTEVFAATETSGEQVHGKNSPASPTPILDGDRVYVHFGHNGTACLTRNGEILWRNNSLRYEPVHGSGGSPVLVADHLIFNADGAAEPFVVALNKDTGAVIWKVPRTVQPRQTFSFATPLAVSVGGRTHVITPGAGAVSSLDPATGRELWRVSYGSGYSVVPRPVFAHGLVFVATGFGRADLLAIRPDGDGDVTDTHIAWRTTKGAPLTPSVIVVGAELFAVNDAGIASCWDATTGKLHWQERIEGNYSASPLAADGRIYFQNETGTGTVLQAGRVFRKLATNKLGERTLASYAVAEGSLFIRTEHNLYRIGGSSR